jgi:hypothetical protein
MTRTSLTVDALQRFTTGAVVAASDFNVVIELGYLLSKSIDSLSNTSL